jgi:hypothetical protein
MVKILKRHRPPCRHRMTSSPRPISSTSSSSHQPSSTRLPPSTPDRLPSPRPFLPLLLPAQISKNLTVWSQQAMIRLPSWCVRLAQGSPSPRDILPGLLSRGRLHEPLGAALDCITVISDVRFGLGAGIRTCRPRGRPLPTGASLPAVTSRRRTSSQVAKPCCASLRLRVDTASLGPPG